jgi:type II secretory pathway component PulF
MPNFRYRALNAQQQVVVGELQAEAVQQAIAQLEAAGLTVQSIGFASPETAAREPSHMKASAAGEAPAREAASLDTNRERAVMHAHMSKVLQQGKAIAPALQAYAEEMPSGRRRRQLRTVCRILEQGDMAEATAAFAGLPEYWIPLLSSAASSSDPGLVLREFLEESQRSDELRRQWWLTLAYPVIVTGLAGAILTALSFLVIPPFREIFDSFGLALPSFTQLILAVADWITSGQALVFVVILLAFIALLVQAHRWLPAAMRDWLGDRFGATLGRSTAIAQFSRFTADLLEAGIDLPNALRIAGFATRKPRLRRASWRLANEMEAGGECKLATYRRTLTATLLHALRADMPAASRIHLLKQVSCCHADRARSRLSWTRGIIEPITICVIGLIVGGIVLALFLPLVNLITGLS